MCISSLFTVHWPLVRNRNRTDFDGASDRRWAPASVSVRATCHWHQFVIGSAGDIGIQAEAEGLSAGQDVSTRLECGQLLPSAPRATGLV